MHRNDEYISSPPVGNPLSQTAPIPTYMELKTGLEVRRALIHFSVFFLGCACGFVIYLNFVLLKVRYNL